MPGPVASVPLDDSPPEALRLLRVAERGSAALGIPWGPGMYRELAAEVRRDALRGRLLLGPSGEAVAAALWPDPDPAGRRVRLLVDAGYGTAATAARLVDDVLAEEEGGPVLGVEFPVPGLADDVLAEALRPRGFRRVGRIDLRRPPERPVPRIGPDPPGLRPVVAHDVEPLARLLGEAYVDQREDLAYFRKQVDLGDDLRAAARDLLSGTLGPFWSDASFAVPHPEEPGRWLGAVVVNELDGPLVTEIAVAPAGRRRGLGRALLARAVGASRSHGTDRIRLVATEENHRALGLYLSMGFEPRGDPPSGQWLGPSAFPPPDPDPLGPAGRRPGPPEEATARRPGPVTTS